MAGWSSLLTRADDSLALDTVQHPSNVTPLPRSLDQIRDQIMLLQSECEELEGEREQIAQQLTQRQEQLRVQRFTLAREISTCGISTDMETETDDPR